MRTAPDTTLARCCAGRPAGHASPALLDTYEAERRPVDQHNAQRSLENAVNHFAIGATLGISHESTPEHNMAQLHRMWSDRPEDAWRHQAGAAEPRVVLATALSQILARPVGAPVTSAV